MSLDLFLAPLRLSEVKLIGVVLLVNHPSPESLERLLESDIFAGEREGVRREETVKTLIHITINKLNSHHGRRHLDEARETLQVLPQLLRKEVTPLLLGCKNSTAWLVGEVAPNLRLRPLSNSLHEGLGLQYLAFGLWLPKELLQGMLKDGLRFT